MKRQQGFGLIETLISLAVASMIVISFTSLFVYNLKVSNSNIKKIQANMYLQEAIEAFKDLEQSDWDAIANASCLQASPCYPDIQSNQWTIISGEEALDGGRYTRSVTIKEVHRDQSTFPNNIVQSGGHIDPNTKKITAQISWQNGFHQTETMELETYVYNY